MVQRRQALVEGIAEHTRVEEALTERTTRLEAVRDVAVEITRQLELTTLLGLITRRAVELVGTQSGVLYLWDEATQVLIPQAWHGHERELYNVISPSAWHYGPRFYPTYRHILRCVKLFIYQEKHL